MAFVPVATKTPIGWVQRVASVPFLGAFAVIIGTGFPATLYINAVEALWIPRPLPGPHVAVGFGLAALWSAMLWTRFATRVRIILIPAPLTYAALAVGALFGLFPDL